MAAVRLPDGSELEIRPGDRARDVAERIGPRLLRDAVVAKLDGRLVDLDAPLNGGGEFEVVTKDLPEGLEVLRHSTAHAMAQAILELYPGSKLTLGPPIEDGFFYDIEVAGRITDEDLPRIEERMREIVERDLRSSARRYRKRRPSVSTRTTRTSWRSSATSKTATSRSTARASSSTSPRPARPEHGCSGCFQAAEHRWRLLAWRREQPMLTRVYGTAWPTEKQLKAYLRRLEEAKARGPPQDRPGAQALYLLAGRGAGIPLFLPRGRCSGTSWRVTCARYRAATATTTWTGHLANEKLYEKSGHLEHYKDSMFPPMVDGETRYRPSR